MVQIALCVTWVNERFRFNQFITVRVWLIQSHTPETLLKKSDLLFQKDDLVDASIPEAVIFPYKLKLELTLSTH
jgi:hypothetical protein